MTSAPVLSRPAPASVDGAVTFDVALRLLNGYTFRADFDDTLVPLQTDEPPPLGKGNGPAPSRLLAAAVGNCLASSLLYCLRKARVDVRELHANVATTVARNEDGRLRIEAIDVTLEPTFSAEQSAPLSRCAELFEDYCMVTESVRRGIDVRVSLSPSTSPNGSGPRTT